MRFPYRKKIIIYNIKDYDFLYPNRSLNLIRYYNKKIIEKKVKISILKIKILHKL
jgi:hypothetical protein